MAESADSLVALILALPETAGSALYGMLDVLAATGSLYEELSGAPPSRTRIQPLVVSLDGRPFTCANDIPVRPQHAVDDAPRADFIIVPELWLSPVDDLGDRYEAIYAWLRRQRRDGVAIYSACSGAVVLAASGLLDGCEATSHWGYQDLFRRRFPSVRFRPEPNLVFADAAGRLVTAGGATSWHDLAIHIISRHLSPGDAVRIAKAYLLKWHGEGQAPYANLVRRQPHADSLVRTAETWLSRNFMDAQPVAGVVSACGVPERTLKRRFRAATGSSLIAYVQAVRIEEIKRRLEIQTEAFEVAAEAVGYDNPAFARRLFKRLTGMRPAEYRRMFRPMGSASTDSGPEHSEITTPSSKSYLAGG
jgi:transcriptional regulator GlxA family with amidase domain